MAKISLDIKIEDANVLFRSQQMICKLRQLTLNGWSGMNNELNILSQRIHEEYINCHVILAYHQGKLIGWSLLSREPSEFWFQRGFYDPTHGYLFEVFIAQDFRRKGVATDLIKTAKAFIGNETLCIAPWDDTSCSFYDNCGIYNNKLL